jgi:copper(I)-binding protein
MLTGGIVRNYLSALLIASLCLAAPAVAEVIVNDPWVRAPVAGQKTAGAYMHLTSSSNATVTGVSSPAARTVEIHEMSMDGGVMKMRSVTRLELPAGKPVELKPGSYHVMLIDLVKPLHTGDAVPIIFAVDTGNGKRERVHVRAVVRDAASGGEHHGAK